MILNVLISDLEYEISKSGFIRSSVNVLSKYFFSSLNDLKLKNKNVGER